MLTQKNKIIIVDNEESELYRLGKAFLNVGVGCKTILYDITHETPFNHVRIAFFDINLTLAKEILSDQDIEEIKNNHTQVFNDLANAINQYIAISNGPYALIFWTKNQVLVNAFIKYVREREIEIANPILIGTLDKTLYNDDNLDNLITDLSTLLNSNEQIKFLFELEEACRKAGEKTLNKIHEISPKDTVFGESTTLFDNLDSIFSKIAVSSLGFEHAKENPKKGVYEGLVPILNYEFLNNESLINWDIVTDKLTKAKKHSDITIGEPSVQPNINSLYHIENSLTGLQNLQTTRGAVFLLDKSNPELLHNFGIHNADRWFNDLIPINDSTKRRSLRGNSQLIAVEISAACDYSNKKSRINKYILGIIVDDFDTNQYLDKYRRSESSYHLGGCSFYLNGNPKQIWLNLNFVFSALPNDSRLANPTFILKKEIMDMLGNKYASHISRIGITSI
ncbi:hypothetical protein JSO59_010545 [Riemerella anatipestifer]|uniref:hypothetical protein n=1 Tax=Riemerella anatipestifer TaxID=34085 RepID=UPI0030C6394D